MTESNSKAALYARVSTQDQNLDNQVELLEEWAESEDYDYDLYSEEVSALSERPKFEEIMDNLDDYDVVVVRHLDRFGRSTIDVLRKIEELGEKDIGFVTVDQPIDTRDDSPMAKVFLTIMSAFAEFERNIMKRRMKKGIEKAKEEGTMGRPRKLSEEHEEKIREWYSRGISGTDIKRRLEDGVGGVEPVTVSQSTVYSAIDRVTEDDSN